MGASKLTPTRPLIPLGPYTERVVSLGNKTGATTIDCAQGNVFELTAVGNVVIAFANIPVAGLAYTATISVRQDATGGRTITWPAGTAWAWGFAPSLSAAGGLDEFSLVTVDGGATWRGYQGAKGYA